MAVSNIYKPYAAVADAALINGVTALAVNTGTELTSERTGFNVSPEFIAINKQNPVATFSSLNIKTVLDNIDVQGQSIGGMAAGMAFWFQKAIEGGKREATLKHRKYVMTEGVIVPASLTADHQSDASIDVEATASYDGSNDPVQITDLQTLPTAVLDVLRYTLGKATIGAIPFTQIQSMDIQFGVTVVAIGEESNIWPTYVYIDKIEPIITFSGIDIEVAKAANFPLLGGKVFTHANTSFYLKKYAQGGKFVSDGTAEHIKFTAAGLARIEDGGSGTPDSEATVNLILTCQADGANNALTVNTASAIT